MLNFCLPFCWFGRVGLLLPCFAVGAGLYSLLHCGPAVVHQLFPWTVGSVFPFHFRWLGDDRRVASWQVCSNGWHVGDLVWRWGWPDDDDFLGECICHSDFQRMPQCVDVCTFSGIESWQGEPKHSDQYTIVTEADVFDAVRILCRRSRTLSSLYSFFLQRVKIFVVLPVVFSMVQVMAWGSANGFLMGSTLEFAFAYSCHLARYVVVFSNQPAGGRDLIHYSNMLYKQR